MKYYLIKSVARPTADNQHFQGACYTNYYGKGEHEVSDFIWDSKELVQEGKPIPCYVEASGYKTKAEATHGLKHYKNLHTWMEENSFWTYTDEIVEVEV